MKLRFYRANCKLLKRSKLLNTLVCCISMRLMNEFEARGCDVKNLMHFNRRKLFYSYQIFYTPMCFQLQINVLAQNFAKKNLLRQK